MGEEYPFIMYQPHYLRRAHTAYDEATWGREALKNPIYMNSADADAKGIKTGDPVLVYNENGKIVRTASVMDSIMPGAVALPHGARSYIDPETGIDFGGNENMLVTEKCMDEFFPHCDTYNSCQVNFEKYDGVLEEDAYMAPKLWEED